MYGDGGSFCLVPRSKLKYKDEKPHISPSPQKRKLFPHFSPWACLQANDTAASTTEKSSYPLYGSPYQNQI